MFDPMTHQSMEEVMKIVANDTEKSILKQLNEFIKRDLIVIEAKEPMIVQDPMSREIEVKTFVELKLKDSEYIEKLEAENYKLRDILNKIRTEI